MLGIENTMATPRHFDAWLDEQDHDRLVAPSIPEHCFLAQFLKDRGYAQVSVYLDSIRYERAGELVYFECPAWAVEFQGQALGCRDEAAPGTPWNDARFDYTKVWHLECRSRITVATARRCLERVMSGDIAMVS